MFFFCSYFIGHTQKVHWFPAIASGTTWSSWSLVLFCDHFEASSLQTQVHSKHGSKMLSQHSKCTESLHYKISFPKNVSICIRVSIFLHPCRWQMAPLQRSSPGMEEVWGEKNKKKSKIKNTTWNVQTVAAVETPDFTLGFVCLMLPPLMARTLQVGGMSMNAWTAFALLPAKHKTIWSNVCFCFVCHPPVYLCVNRKKLAYITHRRWSISVVLQNKRGA